MAAIQTLSAKNATVARIVVSKTTDWNKGQDYVFEAADSAKREQGDRYDPEAGELLAMGRAFQRLGREMVSQGNKRVQNVLDDQAEQSARAEERREAKTRPVKRRTREQWEEIQRQRRREQIYQHADEIREHLEQGFPAVVTWGGHPEPMAATPEGARVELANDRYMTIEDDCVCMRHTSTGEVIVRFERA